MMNSERKQTRPFCETTSRRTSGFTRKGEPFAIRHWLFTIVFAIHHSLFAIIFVGCAPDGNRLVYKHMSRNQRAEAQHRWEAMRGDVKRQLAQQHLAEGRLDDAEQALGEAITLSPDAPQAYLLTAKLRLEEGRLQGAAVA